MSALRYCKNTSDLHIPLEALLLDGGVEDYEYLNKSRREVDGINDTQEWGLLKVSISLRTTIGALTR